MMELSNWQPDLSTFPPSLRIVASTTSRFIRDEVERTVLYETSLLSLPKDLMEWVFQNGIRPQDLHHLLLDVDDEDFDDILDNACDMIKKLQKLETPFVAVKPLSSSASNRQAFADYIKKRSIRYIELDWNQQYAEGSLMPPQWLEM